MKKIKRMSIKEARCARLSKNKKNYNLIEKKYFKDRDTIKLSVTFQIRELIGIYELDSDKELISCVLADAHTTNEFKKSQEILKDEKLNYCDLIDLSDFPFAVAGSASKTDFDYGTDETPTIEEWIGLFKKYVSDDIKYYSR